MLRVSTSPGLPGLLPNQINIQLAPSSNWISTMTMRFTCIFMRPGSLIVVRVCACPVMCCAAFVHWFTLPNHSHFYTTTPFEVKRRRSGGVW